MLPGILCWRCQFAVGPNANCFNGGGNARGRNDQAYWLLHRAHWMCCQNDRCWCASLFYLVSGQTFPGNDRTTTCAKHEHRRQRIQAYYSSGRGHKAHIPLILLLSKDTSPATTALLRQYLSRKD